MRRAGTRVRQRIEDDGGCRCHIQLRRWGFASPGPGTQDPRAACGDGERVVSWLEFLQYLYFNVGDRYVEFGRAVLSANDETTKIPFSLQFPRLIGVDIGNFQENSFRWPGTINAVTRLIFTRWGCVSRYS